MTFYPIDDDNSNSDTDKMFIIINYEKKNEANNKPIILQ